METAKRNHNYKGGSIASNGYKLQYVGKEHHLADVRGYAYEHRIEAEKKLGRRLLPREEVHHDDDNKLNNTHKNLIICKNKAEHRVLHRKKDMGKKLPGQRNRRIKCACGCGGTFLKFDSINRPRKFISGHNARKNGKYKN